MTQPIQASATFDNAIIITVHCRAGCENKVYDALQKRLEPSTEKFIVPPEPAPLGSDDANAVQLVWPTTTQPWTPVKEILREIGGWQLNLTETAFGVGITYGISGGQPGQDALSRLGLEDSEFLIVDEGSEVSIGYLQFAEWDTGVLFTIRVAWGPGDDAATQKALLSASGTAVMLDLLLIKFQLLELDVLASEKRECYRSLEKDLDRTLDRFAYLESPGLISDRLLEQAMIRVRQAAAIAGDFAIKTVELNAQVENLKRRTKSGFHMKLCRHFRDLASQALRRVERQRLLIASRVDALRNVTAALQVQREAVAEGARRAFKAKLAVAGIALSIASLVDTNFASQVLAYVDESWRNDGIKQFCFRTTVVLVGGVAAYVLLYLGPLLAHTKEWWRSAPRDSPRPGDKRR